MMIIKQTIIKEYSKNVHTRNFKKNKRHAPACGTFAEEARSKDKKPMPGGTPGADCRTI